MFGDPEPLTSSKPAKKSLSPSLQRSVVDGVQVYEALAAEIDRGTGLFTASSVCRTSMRNSTRLYSS
ncbi:MAG: hypothetical protein ACLTCP_13505 [Ruminococcus bicirculans (ex Wegman et al. 2014)]